MHETDEGGTHVQGTLPMESSVHLPGQRMNTTSKSHKDAQSEAAHVGPPNFKKEHTNALMLNQI